jgi:hypothetical protein
MLIEGTRVKLISPDDENKEVLALATVFQASGDFNAFCGYIQ